MSTQGKQIGGTVGSIGGGIVGSAFGPVGTMVGSSLGGMVGGMLGGMFGGDDPKPQVPQIDPKIANSQVADAVKNRLRLRAMGQDALNPADTMLNRQIQQNAASSNSLAASARGTNAGLAQRLAQQNLANTNMQAMQNAGVVNAQQQNVNLQQYLGNLEANRAARLQLAQIQQGGNIANMNAQMAQKQADNQFLGGLLNTAGTLGAAYIGKPGATPAAGTT